ncbi:MAG: hypothetical protein LBP19_09765 [Treponema sp.]|nr:hypothetical protein [Treponema sp.]
MNKSILQFKTIIIAETANDAYHPVLPYVPRCHAAKGEFTAMDDPPPPPILL